MIPLFAPSVSGSSRFLMRANRPVIVSQGYHYSDVPEDTFVKVRSELNPEEYESAIEKILADYKGYIRRIKKYTEKTSWKNTIEVHMKLYKKFIKKT